jgi:tRNA (cytidine32/uridine32-2'-O)-methyltransferase
MIIAYELFLASKGPRPPASEELAPSETVEEFYQHLQKTLVDIDFLEGSQPERMMFTLRQMFGRSRMGKRDVAILRGILTAIERAVRTDSR